MKATGSEVKVELKICERCGGLWLRPAVSGWSYCRPCKAKMDELPAVRRKQARAHCGGGERAQ